MRCTMLKAYRRRCVLSRTFSRRTPPVHGRVVLLRSCATEAGAVEVRRKIDALWAAALPYDSTEAETLQEWGLGVCTELLSGSSPVNPARQYASDAGLIQVLTDLLHSPTTTPTNAPTFSAFSTIGAMSTIAELRNMTWSIATSSVRSSMCAAP